MYSAGLHEKQKLVAVHLGRELRKQLKKRSLPVRKGDKILVFRGKFKKREGTVSRVTLKHSRVFAAEILLKKQSGKEMMAPLNPSNLILTQIVERKHKQGKKKHVASVAAAAKPAVKEVEKEG